MTQGPGVWDEDLSKPVHGPGIPNVTAAVAAPTQAEFNALVTAFNTLLAAARSAGVIAQD